MDLWLSRELEAIIMRVSFVSLLLNVPASVPQRQNSSDHCTYYHTETEAADQTCYLKQSQYRPTDSSPTTPSTVPDRVTTGVPIFKSLI